MIIVAVSENAALGQLQAFLTPPLQGVVLLARTTPEYALAILLGLAILAALLCDLVLARSIVDIGLDEPIVKTMVGGQVSMYLFLKTCLAS